jgi:hypothetical protein
MKIFYTCAVCGDGIDTIEVDKVDEVRFGFDCLTGQEREDIIKIDEANNIMYVKSLCDSCIESLGLADEMPLVRGVTHVH